MFQVKSRFTGHVLFECELDAEIAARPFRFQLGFAVRKAVEARAHLTGADLTGVHLTGADLTDADLTDADLRGAVLTGAVLRDAVLTDAVLRDIENDFVAAVLCMPNELEALRAAMTDGRIDGSTYSRPCACLAGTLAHARGIAAYSGGDIGMFVADASSPRERWFMGIRPGDIPETNQVSKIALGWLDKAIAVRDAIRAGATPAGEPAP